MNDRYKILRSSALIALFTILFGGIFCPAKLTAQQTDSLWRDINYIRLSDIRLSGYNMTGLRYLPVNNASEAKIYTRKDIGDFINYYESDNSFKLGAEVESYYRLNKKSVFYGKVGYSYFKGRNMGGSFFINPNYNPIDIQESADSTRGIKKKELYHLIGGVSVDLHPKISIGGKIDYEVGNYSKQKDLRHVNRFLDLKATIGVSYRLKKGVELGANYYFNRNVENLEFLREGNTDKTYESLISIGNYIGKKEQFGEDGYYTAKNKRTPMVNKFHGASLQLYLSPVKQFSIFNEVTYKSRKGYYGVPATASIVLTEHSSDILEYHVAFALQKERSLHTLNINVSHEDLKNNENIFRKETTPGETSVISYYGRSEILKKEELCISAEYLGHLEIDNYHPAWVIKAGFDFYRRQQTASLYPFYRRQTVNSYSVNISGKHHIKIGENNMYSVGLLASYRAGDGTPFYDALYAEPSDSQKDVYKTNDRYLYREFEYLTLQQITGGVNFRYSTTFIKGVKSYVQADYGLAKAFDVRYIEGNFHNTISLTLGCTF
ncbi:hypothetical protein JGH11_08800 [Dysgonomonas sp. Marseille-P4677]|uniref:DUF6850 family outer membrane beta-barrel protein n=1 Tax=Dysgonomonas sp. Marseille-P4677 TaxID=2364790 RepID=UPI001913FFD5|nr:DUF6850 family outer membrane beta-barrel protein [Dysgonomonas sp. Marseille-P4677]MBK5720968.1 hypothetical protein [Dysgonomonas sp. Marseille-P4677]